MALTLTKDEQTIVLAALDREIDSAKRQQNMKGKTPLIKQVYEQQERTVRAVRDKVAESK